MTPLDHKIKTAAEKPPLDLIPLRALTGPSRAFQHGEIKYEIGNYLRALDNAATCNRYSGAALRHLSGMQGLDGVYSKPDAIDGESGLPHIDHLIASLLMLRSILIQSERLPEDPGQSRFVRDAARSLANVLAEREIKALAREAQAVAVGYREIPSQFAPLSDLAGLAEREAERDENTWRGYTGPGAPVVAAKVARPGHDADCHGGYVCEASCGRAPPVTSDSWFTRHPFGSPERVQAVEEHRAAVVSAAAMAVNHAEEM